MKTVILVGGKGTRLKDLAANIPKPMVKIGDIPILEHQVRLLRRYSFTDIILITGHLSSVIENHFGDGSRFGVNIGYYRERTPLGTTGGLKEIEHKLESDFLVLYGDVMLDINIPKLVDFHQSQNAVCTLVLHPNDHPYDSDLVEIDGKFRVTAFHPKPHADGEWYHNLVNAAVYVMSPSILEFIDKGVRADFGSDLFPKIYNKVSLYGYNTAEYIKDAGTPGRLESVSRDYMSGKIRRLNSENVRGAIFLDRDGVINREVNLLHRAEDFELLPGVCDAIKKINETEYLSVVVTNQSVVARNLCSIAGLGEIHKKMETLLGNERAKLDAIYYCPHHPDKGYPEEIPEYKIPCDCRKPGIGMIQRAQKEFNIDLAASFIIGDSWRDIRCGQSAGLTTVAVRSGDAEELAGVSPDYSFQDLGEAVDFLVQDPLADCFDQVWDKIDTPLNKVPFVITIGGNSRSGKSILARYLETKLTEKGLSVLTVQLDHWLIPIEKRVPGGNVYTRFQMEKMERDLRGLVHGNEEVQLSRYDPVIRSHSEELLTYHLGNEQIVIIEGVVALSREKMRSLSSLKIFCSIERLLLNERLRNYYGWKRLPVDEIDLLLQSRERDEYSLIQDDRNWADLILPAEKVSRDYH